MTTIKTILLLSATVLVSPALANSYACITSSAAPSVAYCYEDSHDVVNGVEIPTAPSRIETLKGDNISRYLETDLKSHFTNWKNVKNSNLTEENSAGELGFNVSIGGKTVLKAPYIAPQSLKGGSVVVTKSGLLFDGVPASQLLYNFALKD